MLRGLTTITFTADNVGAARDWYADLLGVDAYFANPEGGNPAYVEFRLGDHQHELGIMDRRYQPADRPDTPGGAIAYWHVDDLHASVERALAAGATMDQEPTERGPGFVTASVVDPFGNILGLMFNQHYLDMLDQS